MNTIKIIRDLLRDEAAEGQKMNVLARFIVAQVKFLRTDCFTFQWIRGITLNAVHHRASSTGCFYYKYYDPAEMKLVERYLHNGDVFADVGSNIGSWGLFAASCGAKTYAVEPAPSTFALLKNNISLNPGLKDLIEPVQSAVGTGGGSVLFTVDNDSENRVVTVEDCEGLITQSVECKTLDEICHGALDVAKIDVENYEIPVLKGAKGILSSGNLNIIVIEVFDNYRQIDDLLRSYGYVQYIYDYKNNVLKKHHDRGCGNNAIYIKNSNFP